MTRDLLIRGARIIDGSGAPWFLGDVRVAQGRIAAVGAQLPTDGAQVLDADGRYLAPGFIDAHTHDDLMFLREPERLEKAIQGVTTIVVGNCSFSLYPRAAASVDALRGHFGALLGETAEAETFGDFAAYKEALEANGIALNLVSLVGHGALRIAVMGYDERAPTAAELSQMRRLLARDLAAGAAGLSLGLVYPPSAFANTAELVALAETVAEHHGVLAAHVRSYEASLIPAVDEFLDLLKRSGTAGLLSHLQAAGKPNWGGVGRAIKRLEAARADGIDVSFDMYPYPAGSSTILQLLPPTAQSGGIDALIGRLKDPVERAGLRQAVEEGDGRNGTWPSKVKLIGWNNVRIAGVELPELKRFEGKAMDAAAAEAGLEPFDFLADLVTRDQGRTTIVMFQLGEADLRAAFTHPLHMVGSDSLPRPGTRPHPRAYGTFPRVLGKLSRDEGWLGLEDAVRRMTSIAAQRFGLMDRGLVRPGLAADLVLFEPDLADLASFDSPTELASGIDRVWVAGETILADGKPTGLRPGRVLGRH
ncbi:aminoacylase [Aliidongia dinghuensis]|uniref:Aminoacylase n=1 Tax=Aliidongia dinghuensis TaxID=1867774 RepID=A0A8J2YSR2_9PROT|nr:D-aminoacylase [Aliidongia dinghuensis]GGF10027.1 aminoacylase [Aliidongia dinghuensis]